jgi:hypothetical protein
MGHYGLDSCSRSCFFSLFCSCPLFLLFSEERWMMILAERFLTSASYLHDLLGSCIVAISPNYM